jgi:hypothetical protein
MIWRSEHNWSYRDSVSDPSVIQPVASRWLRHRGKLNQNWKFVLHAGQVSLFRISVMLIFQTRLVVNMLWVFLICRRKFDCWAVLVKLNFLTLLTRSLVQRWNCIELVGGVRGCVIAQWSGIECYWKFSLAEYWVCAFLILCVWERERQGMLRALFCTAVTTFWRGWRGCFPPPQAFTVTGSCKYKRHLKIRKLFYMNCYSCTF